MAFRNYILLFALVASTIAGPINVQDGDLNCATTCEASLSDNGKFQYSPGTTYTYTYEGSTETRLQGSSEQTTSLKIDATADIEVLSKCEFALQLRGVTLTENGQTSSSSNEFRQKLEAKPLRFAFQDGVIENVCSTQGEDERVLNIKRGVLSTFQNSMTELSKEGLFTETDVSGTCPTTYTSSSSTFGGTFTITKSKDILACIDRTGNISSIHSERYNVPSKMQNAPLLKSTHQCEQTISKHLINEAKCTEVLVFRPFSKDGSGAVTTAKQNLKFSSKKSSVSVTKSQVHQRSSMLFHHMYDESIDMNAKSDVIALLQDICSEVNDDIKKSSPQLFGALVSKMKRLDSDKMLQVYTAVNGERICASLRGKQFFYDAVPMVATEASLALTKKLISEKIVQGIEADSWLTQLAFIPRPTFEMLAVIQPLLNDETYKSKALLGISAMVHKICDSNVNCQSNTHVADFINILNANIGSACSSTTKQQRDLIIVTLKAFGNAGDAVTSSSVIGRCITQTDLDTEIRVNALQAYRRMPCSVSREDAMRLYQNFENDAELRIHAFLAVMSCPTNVLSKVRMVLSGEPVNQVGSFVWTYLENLKETSSPLRQELSSILDDAKLRQDFNLDARKFSRNLEKSYFSDYLNAGAQIESNLIWSQRSYIPRSAMLNVTVEMFGNSINLVELGGRVQGLEKIVEKFFGPNGYFSQKNTKELMDNKRQTAANYISSFDNMFKTPDDKITTSMYIKMFGNELQFSELDSSDWTDLQGFNILDFLIKMAEPKKIDLTKNVQFLDSSLVVPTCVGLPMNLTVNGTASVSVDIDGNVDLRNIAASPRSFDINGHIKPSAAIMISGMMGVDAIVTKSSMKMVASMHSSTQLDGKVTLNDGQIFNVQLNTPKEKMEIFHVETEFFMNGQEMAMPEPAKVYKKCTPAGMTKVIGMEMCVDVTLPTFHKTGLPLPPFTGPMNAQIFIEKKDTHTGYAFTAKYENSKAQISGSTYDKKVIHISLDTPGSQVDRKLLIEGAFDPASMAASAQIMTPWKKFEWTTSFANTVTLKRAQSTLKIDGTQTYAADAQLAIEKKNVKTVWTPSLSITIPDKPDMSISGTFQMGTGKTVAAIDLTVKNFSRKPITLTSSLSQISDGKSYDFAFDVKSDLFKTNIASSVAVATGSYAGNAVIEYSMQGRPEHRFNLAGKFVDESIGDLRKYSVNAGFIPTEFPTYQFNFDGALQVTANHIDTSLTIECDHEKLSLGHKSTKQGSWDNLNVETSTYFKYPSKNIDISGELTHQHNVEVVKSSGSVTYAGQSVRTSVNLDRSVDDKYSGEATLSYPGRDLSFNANVNKMMDGEHKILIKSKWGSDADSQMSITSTYKSGEIHQVTSDIQIPGYPIALSISVKPNLVDFMGQTAVIYNGETYSLQSEYKVDTTSFTGSGVWSCSHRRLSYNVDMSNVDGKMKAETEFSWDTSKKVSMSAEYNNRDSTDMYSRDGKVSISTPFGTQSYSSEFELKLADKFLRIKHELVMDGERSTLTGRYSLGSGELTLSTPFIKYGEVEFMNVEFSHDTNSVSAEVSWTPTQQISGNARWSDSSYSVDFVTPFNPAKLGVSVEHTATTSALIKGYWNKQEASLTMSRTGVQKFQFTLAYPEHTLSGSLSQKGDLALFTGGAEFNFDTQKYWSKVVFSGKGPISLELDVNTPLKIKKISANFNLEGTITEFNTQASLIWDNNRIRSSMKFSGTEAEFVLNTPSRKVNAEYTFTGEMESFSTNALLKWADDKQIDGSLTFDMKNAIKMTFEINSPFYSTIGGSVEHSGTVTNFNNKATFTWVPTKTIVVSSEFNQDRSSGKVGIKGVPMEEFKSGELSFAMTRSTLEKAEVVSTLTWNENQSIIGRVSVSKDNGYGFSASLVAPNLEKISADMTHTQTKESIHNQATVQWSSKKITSSIDITTTSSGVEAKINVNTPDRQMAFTASKQGNADEFVAYSTFSWETGKEISSHLEFSHITDMKLVWSLDTPWEMVKNVGFTITLQPQPTYFKNQMEVRYNGQTANLATTLSMKSGASLRVLSTNPWKNFNTNIVYEGTLTDFTASADFTMDEKTYSTKTKVAYADTITLTFDINTVIYKPVSLAVHLSGEENNAYLKWNTDKTISARATLSINENTNSVDSLINFKTPFEGYESGEATLRHTGTLKSFREIAEISFNAYTGRFEAGFSSTGEIRGDMELTSSWYNAKGSFRHSGDWKEFSNSADFTYAAGKTITTSSNWNLLGVTGEMRFAAPFKTINAKFSHQNTLSNEISTHAELSIDDQQMFLSDLTFKYPSNNINFEFSFTCPIKSFSATYTHTGTMATRCRANAEFTWDSTNKMAADWNVSMINGFATDVEIRTPWKNLSGEIKHTGTNMKSFENTISVTYEAGKTIALDTSFRTSPDFVVESKFTSPFKNANILYRHSGNFDSFACHLEGAYDTMPLTADLKWDMISATRAGSAKITSPWKVLSATYECEGPWENFDSTVNFSWETDKKIVLEAKADSRSGMDTLWKLSTPWRALSAELKYDMDFNVNTELSWETGKSVRAEITNGMTENSMESTMNINTPWRNLSAYYKRDGIKTKFDATTHFSWDAGREIRMVNSFDMDSMDASTTISTPWRDVSFMVNQSGDLTKFTGDYEVSWDADKKITTNLHFNRENGWDSRVKIESPWKTIVSNSKFNGELAAFTSSFDFSWETGKTMSTSASFNMNPLAATWSYKCPSYQLSADIKHEGSVKDFSNSASFSWEPTKKIEVSSSFKNMSNIMGSVSIKSPFYTNLDLSFKHTATSGEMSFVSPITEDLSVTYKYTDGYNFDSKVTYGSTDYTCEGVTTWNNGLQTVMKINYPDTSCTFEMDHQGDLSAFTNKMEAKWNDEVLKLTTNADVSKWTFSQILETPFLDYETMSWSATMNLTENSVSSQLLVAKNTDKFAVELDADVEWKKVKSIFTYSLKVDTPFAGYEENKLSEVWEYSPRRVSWKGTSYFGSIANTKVFEIFSMATGSDTKAHLETYVKATIDSETSEISFTYDLEPEQLTATYKSDVKYYPEMNGEIKLTVDHSLTGSSLNQRGSVDVTTIGGTRKIMWNAGSNGNMCETGFSVTSDGEEVVTYTHKTTWTSDYLKLDNEMIFKTTKSEMFADCEFKVSYDLTKSTKTVGITLFNNPSKPFDFKSEVVMGDNMSVMVELTTPFEECKISKTTLTVNKGQQPWTVTMESSLNGQAISFEGSVSFEAPAIFNVNMSFKSEIPMYESLSVTLTNSKLQDQWKPHMVIQYASDKTIEISGTFSWVNQYKATMDINTPFDALRSVVADITIDNEFPTKMSSSLEFKTSQMSEKLSSEMSFDMDARSFSLTVQSPFEAVRNFQLSGYAKPRLSMIVKLNGENLFTLSGNTQLESWTKHNLDVTMTYPFFNQYTRIQMNNDLSMAEHSSMNSYIDFAYTREKEISFKLDYKPGSTTTFSVVMETPFEKLEKTTYVGTYSGSPQSWTETTHAESYYGTINTSTSFSMVDGITYHQIVTGDMKNGIDSFKLQKDLVFTGNANKFDIQTKIAGSFVPTIVFETAWQYDPMVFSLKASLNKHSVDYNHRGLWSDFTCTWTLSTPITSHFGYDAIEDLTGTWSFKKDNGYTFSANISCPEHNYKLSWAANSLSGNFDFDAKSGTETVRYTGSYKRSATPYRFEGSFTSECHGNKLVSSIVLTENSIDFPMINWNNKELFAIRAKNPLNDDEEYQPTIIIVLEDNTYEFDGLYKNVGEGLVRDFKLHMVGPRGLLDTINFQFEFRTLSNQLVPGDMKLYLSHTPEDQAEFKLIDMSATWGNDKAKILFIEPYPMKYTADFSVSTTGQSAMFEANWDTSAADRSAKLEIVNKFSSSSSKLVSNVDINIIYTGISRGFNSELEWTSDSFKHLLTLDYNGKSIGYDIKFDEASGSSVELITQWRSVKWTWKSQSVSNGNELQFGLYWDSQRDTQKRFLGTSRWQKTGTNTYKWTTTVSHPALVKDFTITDLISYNTSKYYFDVKKVISYSTDSSKDISFDMNVQKDLKWGIDIKQVYNKIDIHIGEEFSKTGIISSVNYMAANGKMKKFVFTTSYNPSTMAASVELQTPMKTVKFSTLSTKTTCTFSMTVDGNTYTSDFTLRPDDYYMLIKLSGMKTNVELEAQKLVRGYQIQLTKIEGSKSTIEGLAAISMNESRTVNAKLQWNPTLVSEIKDQIAALRSSLKDTIKSMSTAATNELSKKVNKMRLGSDFDQMISQHETEVELLESDIATAKLMMQRGYDQDIFFMKSIDEATSACLIAMAIQFNATQAKVAEYYQDVIRPKLSLLGEKAGQVMLDLSSELGNIAAHIQQCSSMMATRWMERTQMMRVHVAIWLQPYIDIVSEYMAEHPIVQTLKSYHVAIMTKFNSVSALVYNQVIEIANPLIYTDVIFSVNTYVKDAITNSVLARSIDVSAITGLCDTIMYQLKFFFEYYDVTGNMKLFMTHAKNVAAEYLDEYLTHYIDQTLDHFNWVTYDLAAGNIEVEFVVPTMLNKIDLMQIRSYFMSGFRLFMTHLYNYHFNLTDLFYMYIPSAYTHILPPFNAQGIIAGQHIRTFDRRHYDFSSGKCSYLLARDFDDGNFTIFVNYIGEEQSLTVHSNGKIIDIQQDNSVKMGGSKIELPVQFFNTSITRMGSKIILSNTLGVKVICDNMYGLCTVEMNGHYFAKTGGLFGTYNYEPLDDFTTSSNTNSTDVLSFANSWTTRCAGTNTAQTFSHIASTKEYTACAVLFKDTTSSLGACFDTVNPEQAFHKCITDMSKDVTSTATNGPCKAAMFYQAECKFAGIVLPVPSQCVLCSVSDMNILQGESQQISQPIMAADVVFVIEEKMCNYDIDGRLQDLAKLIESSLSRKSFSDIRFGLVGFGGENVHSPSHVHTMDSKMFAARTELALGSAALQISEAGNNKDVFDAIDFASQYPFRAGANKVIVVIPCSDCSESKHSYGSIAERLSSEDITMHLINDFSYEISVSGKNPPTNYLFGIDNRAVYSLRDLGTGKGNTRLYPIIGKPSDACSSLALYTDGTVFDLKMMTRMRTETIKRFQTVFANRLAVTASPSRCTSCSCEYNEMFMMSRTVCTKC